MVHCFTITDKEAFIDMYDHGITPKHETQSEDDSSIELNLDLSEECPTEVNSKFIDLRSKIQIRNTSLEFKEMEVVMEYDSSIYKTHRWDVHPDVFAISDRLDFNIPYLELVSEEVLTIFSSSIIELRVSVIADGEQIVVQSGTLKLLPSVELLVECSSVYSLVFQQNEFSLASRIELVNQSLETFEHVKVVTEFDSPEFEPVKWEISELARGQSVSLKVGQLRFSATSLEALNEKRIIQLRFSVYTSGSFVHEVIKEVTLLPKNHWGGESHMPELLAAFVTPNTNYCNALIKRASSLLLKEGHDSKLDGYQSKSRERPYIVAAALWSVVCNEGISYCVPPASFSKSGQKIRLCNDIANYKLATCIDTALLFASCLEQAGLNSVIALTKGHAMVGVWLVDEAFPLLTNDDPADLRNRIALKDLVLFETTLATSDKPISFSQALKEADRKISERLESEFVYILDIKQARSRKIEPIDFNQSEFSSVEDGATKQNVELPPLPVLPPVVRQNPLGGELSPDGRVDQWRRKLLDLSKRNKLLNIKNRSMGFQIICPDLGALEDELAAGKKYNLISRNDGGASLRGRSENYTMQTGGDLEVDFVCDQLKKGNLIANCEKRDLEKNLINLFRRAKLDLEEGGANTLFLAIGMLKWKDDPNSDLFYKAPLILLPVKLERTSARAKPKLMQLEGEAPVFNLTLVELLLQDFEIDLSVYQQQLPKDESGVDVAQIWNTVRLKIKDTPSFEVVEELLLSNFSFAKYLMWKDLSDRIDDLKSSRLVEHLIEKSTEPYPFDADFIDNKNVDKRIDTENFYAPLNADSSQIIAIDASAKNQDFVLEGPPGTGKSETIANIISHNIALGRKVLFVSEKMAALDVVYTRLKKVGLDHLCLELHSNKISKKGVCNQLKEAWQIRDSNRQLDWKRKTSELQSIKDQLNLYVEELHEKSVFGFSVHNAIARSVCRGSTTRLDLGWKDHCPIENAEEFESLKLLANDLGLAYQEIVNLDSGLFSLVTNSNWSNMWQSNLIDAAVDLKTLVSEYERGLVDFVDSLGVDNPIGLDFESSFYWVDIARICIEASSESFKIALAKGATELIDGFGDFITLRQLYESSIQENRINIGRDEFLRIPIHEWSDDRDSIESSGDYLNLYKFDTDIIEELRQKEVDVLCQFELQNRKEISALRSESDRLSNDINCIVPFLELTGLPLANWLQKLESGVGLLHDRFVVGCSVLQEMRVRGYEFTEEIFEMRLPFLEPLQTEYRELLVDCECSLTQEEVAVLPVSIWIGQRNDSLSKNFLSKSMVQSGIRKEMKSYALKPVKDLSILDKYKRLVEIVVEIQTIYLIRVVSLSQKVLGLVVRQRCDLVGRALLSYKSINDLITEIDRRIVLYAGDGVLDTWNVNIQEIQNRIDRIKFVRNTVVKVAGYFESPIEFVEQLSKKLVLNREFLTSSRLVGDAHNYLNLSETTKVQLENFERVAGRSNVHRSDFVSLKNSLLQIVNSASDLNAWCRWIGLKERAASMGLTAVCSSLESGIIDCDEVEEQTVSAFCKWLVPRLIDESDVLRGFNARKHEQLVESFRALDDDVANITGSYIAAKIASSMPDTRGPNAPQEYGILTRELQRQKGHKPVRQLIQELGANLLDLTPCFMMSPLSIAQFLPADYKVFDLVVFDEASQITVWDAVGAIARGKNVIVVGDPKQMPPTNFFNRSEENDNTDEVDLESILDQAMAARVPYHRLTGHYRSRHESLITFSNHQYYQNSLTTYPCAKAEGSAVTWHKVDGVYSKGVSRNNPIEARSVVNEVVRRLRDPELQKLSIGIVTFNTEQQRLIEDLLDDERRNDSSLERFFKEDCLEHVFVKNLETVQGDQRDVICLSVGFGPTEPTAQTMSMNFGPLNKQGGERRLNVAITRASTEMLVFTSFDSSMIDLSRTSSGAVRDLKAYIDFANRGPKALSERSRFDPDQDQFDSEFEESVANLLRKRGWTIKTQIGVSKFRIDLGVIHPDFSGEFLAGVECDGATYHSSPSARDRDRIRHIILENLGWNLVRIWSTDFFINPEKVINRVHDELNELLQIKRDKLKAAEERRKVDEVSIETSPDDVKLEGGKTDLSMDLIDDEIGLKDPIALKASFTESAEEPLSKELDILAYETYQGDVCFDPRAVNEDTLRGGLMDIVSIEGPMLAKRACDIYLRLCGIKRMGPELRSIMSRALLNSINSNSILSEDECNTSDLLDSIIHIPGHINPRLRKRGDRKIEEIPLREIVEASKFVLAKEGIVFESDEHLRTILALFGFKSLTGRAKNRILKALSPLE